MKTGRVFIVMLLVMTTNAFAAVTISNWSLTDSSLSFDLSGEADSITAPLDARTLDMIYVGAPGNTGWINDFSGHTAIEGTIDGTSLLRGWVNDYAYGHYVNLETVSDCDFTGGGSFINVSVSFSGAGLFNPSSLDITDLIVTWGMNSASPNPFPETVQDLGTAVVPEPSAWAIFPGLIALVAVGLRRIAKRPLLH